MHTHDLGPWRHAHAFGIVDSANERRTALVVGLTAVTMVVEIVAGTVYGSMALLADGWHMGTHVAALSISVFAYRYARRHARDSRFTFGTGKVGVLGGFASAAALAVVAVLIGIESAQRLVTRVPIQFDQAILVAVIGLLVNLVSAFILRGRPSHSHGHDHDVAVHDSHAADHNLRAAYLHVVADALTSVLAIVALISGKFWGYDWLDPVIGIVGGALIARWSYGLLRDTSRILLDSAIDPELIASVRAAIEADSDNKVSDLHVWKVGPNDCAAIVSVVTHYPRPAEHYKELLTHLEGLAHVTVEVHLCASEPLDDAEGEPPGRMPEHGGPA